MSAPGPGPLVASAVQLGALGLGAPLLVGAMRALRARFEGRIGPPVHQPLLDLRKLAGKERLRSEHASGLAAAVPLVLLATTAAVVVISPLVTVEPLLGRSADLFAVVFLLLCGSVALALGGLDAGTAFGGMGASRTMTIGALAEPALLVAVLAFSLPARSSNLPAIVVASLEHPGALASPERLLAAAALAIVILAEAGRLPVDNPATHLELTMVHEATVLDYAGPDLALLTLGEQMRLGYLLALFANLLFPAGIAPGGGALGLALGLGALAGKVAALAGVLVVFEAFSAKLRLFRVPELLGGAFVLAALAVLSGFVLR